MRQWRQDSKLTYSFIDRNQKQGKKKNIFECYWAISNLHFYNAVRSSRPTDGGADLKFGLPKLDFPKPNIGITAVKHLQLVEVERVEPSFSEVKLENLTRADGKNISIIFSQYV